MHLLESKRLQNMHLVTPLHQPAENMNRTNCHKNSKFASDIIILKSQKLAKYASGTMVWGCHSNTPAGWNMKVLVHRLRSPCFPNRLLFVTLPGMGDKNLAPVLTRANWIMHHGEKVFARWNDTRRYFYIHPRPYMSATWSGSESYRISIVMSPNP